MCQVPGYLHSNRQLQTMRENKYPGVPVMKFFYITEIAYDTVFCIFSYKSDETMLSDLLTLG